MLQCNDKGVSCVREKGINLENHLLERCVPLRRYLLVVLSNLLNV